MLRRDVGVLPGRADLPITFVEIYTLIFFSNDQQSLRGLVYATPMRHVGNGGIPHDVLEVGH